MEKTKFASIFFRILAFIFYIGYGLLMYLAITDPSIWIRTISLVAFLLLYFMGGNPGYLFAVCAYKAQLRLNMERAQINERNQ